MTTNLPTQSLIVTLPTGTLALDAARVHLTDALLNWYGGITVQDARGAWLDDNGNAIEDDSIIVTAYVTHDAHESIADLAKLWQTVITLSGETCLLVVTDGAAEMVYPDLEPLTLEDFPESDDERIARQYAAADARDDYADAHPDELAEFWSESPTSVAARDALACRCLDCLEWLHAEANRRMAASRADRGLTLDELEDEPGLERNPVRDALDSIAARDEPGDAWELFNESPARSARRLSAYPTVRIMAEQQEQQEQAPEDRRLLGRVAPDSIPAAKASAEQPINGIIEREAYWLD